MSRKLKVSVLVDAAEIPPNDPDFMQSPEEPSTEYHVISTLRDLGHNVSVLGVEDDIGEFTNTLIEQKPDLVFNLTEQFAGDRRMDKNVAALLEMMDIPFTGTGSTGLMISRDKHLCKQLLSLHKIRVPGFVTLFPGRKFHISKALHYPLIAKPALEDGSEGISNASVVNNEDALIERAEFIHERWNQPAICEEYIEGRELYVAILGNKRLKVLPARECLFNPDDDKGPCFTTYRVKWNSEYRKKWNIEFGFAELEQDVVGNVERICKKVYRILQIRDYGRIDLRLSKDNKIFVLEANANPDIAYGEEVAEAAAKSGISYQQLIGRIIHTALRRYE